MDKYIIEDGIPMPMGENDNRGRLGRTLLAMKVGQSFLIKSNQKTYVHTVAKSKQVKIATRAEAGGFRVWRVA